MKKVIDINEAIWKRFEIVAVAEFGLYGAITKGVGKAIEEWVQKEEEKYDSKIIQAACEK